MKIVAGVYKRARQNRTSPRSVWALLMIAFGAVFVLQVFTAAAITRAQDPGVRTGLPDSGDPLAGMTGPELQCFLAGKEDFVEADDIADGLGPRMNLDSCGGLHAIFTISGRSGAEGCVVLQPDFEAQVAAKNVKFRFPTPVFGAGLIVQ